MKIFIKYLTGKIISLNAEPTDTILCVKAIIHNIEGIPSYHQKLIYNGNELKDGKTLAECNIQNESTLYSTLILRSSPKKYFMKTEAGKTITFYISCDDKIKSVKAIIQNLEGIPRDLQKLIYNGKQLEDNGTLADYNICPESTIDLVIIN